MEYITYKRLKGKALSGEINIPYGTKCHSYKDLIICGDKAVCFTTSENAHQYFMRNDDGLGLEKGKIIIEIMNLLNTRSNSKAKEEKRLSRWDKVWNDKLCQKYKRIEYEDYWLWNHEFYEASIDTLKYILNLIK